MRLSNGVNVTNDPDICINEEMNIIQWCTAIQQTLDSPNQPPSHIRRFPWPQNHIFHPLQGANFPPHPPVWPPTSVPAAIINYSLVVHIRFWAKVRDVWWLSETESLLSEGGQKGFNGFQVYPVQGCNFIFGQLLIFRFAGRIFENGDTEKVKSHGILDFILEKSQLKTKKGNPTNQDSSTFFFIN